MDAENKNRKAVSRRGAPAADKSFKRETTSTASPTRTHSHSPSRPSSHKKKVEDGKNPKMIEMRPLLFGSGTLAEEGGASPTTNNASSSSPAAAKQFADSWLGNYVKLKAKQAEKHAYNLRANLKDKSKKGFHVQIPKRMLFYTVLVFLVLPLILFIIKENHIHDHDPAFHLEKFGKNRTNNSTDSRHRNNDGDDKYPNNMQQLQKNGAGLRGKKNHNQHHHQQNHQSLKQLLAGGLPNNDTSNSRSADSKKRSVTTLEPSTEPVDGTDDNMDKEEEGEPNSSEQSTNPTSSRNVTGSTASAATSADSAESDEPETETDSANQDEQVPEDTDSSGGTALSANPSPGTDAESSSMLIPPLLLAKTTNTTSTGTLLPASNHTALRRMRRHRR